MPLVTAAVLAWAAGLLLGFGASVPWVAGAALLVIGTGARATRDRVALAALVLAGVAVGGATRAGDAACAERLLRASSWHVTLTQEAAPGAFVRGAHDCGVTLWLSVRDGAAPAGARVRASGSVVQGRIGLLVTEAAIRMERAPGLLARWRATVGRGLDARFGAHAPLVRALLIADRAEFSPAMRERFAASGLSHMLSVSGLHVGLIAAAITLATQILGLRRARAQVVIVGVTALYVLAIGMPLPALRAAAMLAVIALSQWTQRPTSPWAVLAVGGGLALVEPRSVMDLGYQLSIVGMAALAGAAALNRRWTWLARPDWRGTLLRGLMVSTIATVLTAPLVAATFGQVSLVAPLSNLVAAPLMALLQPMLFLAALLLPIGPFAQFVADACLPLLVALDAVATFFARMPGASIAVFTDGTGTALACVIVFALLVAMVSRHPWRPLVVAAGCLALVAWRPTLARGDGWTELHLLDVGQGDAVAIRTARGNWLLFDAGRGWSSGDEGRRTIAPYIARRGGALTAFVLSHPHMDHVGGAASVIDVLEPRWYYDPGYAGVNDWYRRSLDAARSTHTVWRRVRPLDSLVVDEVTVTFLAPDSVWADSLRDPNDASTVARVRVGNVRFLLTGDAEAEEEAWLLERYPALLRADVLKVAHHGSRTSSTAAFLDAVRPRLALVSVGAGNMYRHPSADVLRALAVRGAVALRTDQLGTVIVRTDGDALAVTTGGDSWSVIP